MNPWSLHSCYGRRAVAKSRKAEFGTVRVWTKWKVPEGKNPIFREIRILYSSVMWLHTENQLNLSV